MTATPEGLSSFPAQPALAEVREEDAPAALAAIYADIRRATGISVVNLIYRHLATLPGALEWVWPIVRQLYDSGAGPAALERILGALRVPEIAPFDEAALLAAGVDENELAQARNVVEVYNRGNLLNVVGLTTVDRLLRQPSLPPGRAAPGGGGGRLPALDPVRPLPKLTTLDAPTAALVRSLAGLHPAAAGGVVPSLYLHLAICPNVLSLLPKRLGSLVPSSGFGAERDRLREAVGREAENLLAVLAVDAPPPAQSRGAIAAALDTFANGLIPEMALVGLAIKAALPDPGRPSSDR